MNTNLSDHKDNNIDKDTIVRISLDLDLNTINTEQFVSDLEQALGVEINKELLVFET